MNIRYSKILTLFICIFLSRINFAASQQIQLSQVKPSRASHLLAMPNGYSIAHYLTDAQPGQRTTFRHVVLDSALRVRHERNLHIGGRNAQASICGSNQRAAFYRLQWYKGLDDDNASDSTITAVVDTAGQVLSIKRLGTAGGAPPSSVNLQLASDSLFLLCEPTHGNRGFHLRCFDLQQRERWSFAFKPQKHRGTLLRVAADATYAWLLVDDNNRSRRVWHTLFCLDVRTGRVVSTMALDYQQERRIASTILLGPKHSLLVAGRTYYHRRISRKHSGDLFVTRLAPDGALLANHLNPMRGAIGLLGPTFPRTYWQSMATDTAGNVRLLGQAFVSTSYGANVAMVAATRLLTLGFFGISATTLRSRELLNFSVSPAGTVTASRLVPLPGYNAYTEFGYVPGQLMATLADQAGLLPIRHLTPDGRRAVVHTGTSLMLLDLETQQLSLLRSKVRVGDVWRVQPSYVLLYHRPTKGSRHTLELERVALTGN